MSSVACHRNASAGGHDRRRTLDVPQAVDAIEGFDITINGRRVASRESGTIKASDRSGVRHFSVPLSGGANDIEIKATTPSARPRRK